MEGRELLSCCECLRGRWNRVDHPRTEDTGTAALCLGNRAREPPKSELLKVCVHQTRAWIGNNLEDHLITSPCHGQSLPPSARGVQLSEHRKHLSALETSVPAVLGPAGIFLRKAECRVGWWSLRHTLGPEQRQSEPREQQSATLQIGQTRQVSLGAHIDPAAKVSWRGAEFPEKPLWKVSLSRNEV